MSVAVEAAAVEADIPRVRGTNEKQVLASVGQEVRKTVAELFPAGVHFRGRGRRPAGSRNALHDAGRTCGEEDCAVGTPGSSARIARVAERHRRAALYRNLLELSRREKS